MIRAGFPDYDFDKPAAVVIDNGSYMIRAGFAGDDDPCAVFSTVVGHVRTICFSISK